MTIQPAQHESHACCLLRAGSLAFQPVSDNTRGIRVEQVVSLFQKILTGSQLTLVLVSHSKQVYHFLKRMFCVYCDNGARKSQNFRLTQQ